MSTDGRELFTIGHSTHSLEDFLGLLKRHGITTIVDVRSQPYSRIDYFCKDALTAVLKAARIEYVFLGRELGARRDERACYEGGQAIYERVADLPAFREGLVRLDRCAQEQVAAVLCAEKEPLDCHRTILVCRHLRGRGLRIRHILADGTLESHEETEKRLLKLMKIEASLFEPEVTERDLIERAYEARGREIAYRTDSQEVAW
jgi:uncharacterized protein (DUF488 family)